MDHAASESIGLQGDPYRVGRIGTGIHDNRSVRGPGDGESELVTSNTKTCGAVQDYRVRQEPQRRRTPGERRPPAAVPGK